MMCGTAAPQRDDSCDTYVCAHTHTHTQNNVDFPLEMTINYNKLGWNPTKAK